MILDLSVFEIAHAFPLRNFVSSISQKSIDNERRRNKGAAACTD